MDSSKIPNASVHATDATGPIDTIKATSSPTVEGGKKENITGYVSKSQATKGEESDHAGVDVSKKQDVKGSKNDKDNSTSGGISKIQSIEELENDMGGIGFGDISNAHGSIGGKDSDNDGAAVGAEKLSYSMAGMNATPVHGLTPSQKGKKAQVLFHLVRHAQAAHNVKTISHKVAGNIPDPLLTEHGLNQSQHLQATFPNMENIDLIFCSPLNRTIDTALIGFRPFTERGNNIYCWSWLKEWGNTPCNRGSSEKVLRERFKEQPLDFTLMAEAWETEKDPRATREGRGDCERTRDVRRDLRILSQTLIDGGKWCLFEFQKWAEDRNPEVVIVSHGNFLSGLVRSRHSLFRNAEFKTFKFSKDRPSELVETRKSATRVHTSLPYPEKTTMTTITTAITTEAAAMVAEKDTVAKKENVKPGIVSDDLGDCVPSHSGFLGNLEEGASLL